VSAETEHADRPASLSRRALLGLGATAPIAALAACAAPTPS